MTIYLEEIPGFPFPGILKCDLQQYHPCWFKGLRWRTIASPQLGCISGYETTRVQNGFHQPVEVWTWADTTGIEVTVAIVTENPSSKVMFASWWYRGFRQKVPALWQGCAASGEFSELVFRRPATRIRWE